MRPSRLRGLDLVLAIIGIMLLVIGQAAAREPRRDPITGRIRILYVGDPVPGSPYPIFERDPLTDVTRVIASGFNFPTTTIKRYMRQYMPRTAGRLYGNYDVIIISDAGIPFFTDTQMSWFRDGVIEQGLSLVMIGGYEAFGGNIALGSWGPTPVQDVLPVESIADAWESKSGMIVVTEPENPLMASLPFDKIGANGIFYGCNIVEEKLGSTTLARYRVLRGGRTYPLFSYWETGKGSSYAMMADWTPAGGVDFLRWEYYADYTLNVMMYITGGKLPDDPILAYQARQLMADFRNLRQTLDALVEFASKFGANMAAAEIIVGEAEDAKDVAERSYVEGEVRRAIDELKSAMEILDSASEKAYKLKDEALLWVYVTEWLVVASTGMICGFILWTVMVRRSLYREIDQTKLQRL